jgi:alkanesulfonate monooxygenase SsuD/methylene tetrahydromethanopterin reductase-like flavin-dependent oxidoreductase (luciferase family)
VTRRRTCSDALRGGKVFGRGTNTTVIEGAGEIAGRGSPRGSREAFGREMTDGGRRAADGGRLRAVLRGRAVALARRSVRRLAVRAEGKGRARRGRPGLLPPPVDPAEARWSEFEAAGAWRVLRHSAVGSPETVRQWLRDFIAETRADELMVTAQMYDPAARLHSFEIVARLAAAL